MKHRPTRSQIAADYTLWGEYVDPQGRMPRAEFDAMSIKEKVKMQNDIFGATPVADLTGAALDWAVAQGAGSGAKLLFCLGRRFQPSTDWAHGGPVIERERIELEHDGFAWWARIKADEDYTGPTPLIAAMRCYVASKLGDEIELPNELTGE